MTLHFTQYTEQVKSWPASGRHILAQYDEESVIVYQAYHRDIAEFALAHGHFGGPFSYQRMSWIKPNFLWMMYRSGWGTKENQEATLAIRLRRSFFESLLAQAVPSSFDRRRYATPEEWQAAVARSSVRLQWDRDHHPAGAPLDRRAIQLGLRGEVLEAFGRREIVEVIDLGAFVAEQAAHVTAKRYDMLQTPTERVFVPAEPVVAERLGLGKK